MIVLCFVFFFLVLLIDKVIGDLLCFWVCVFYLIVLFGKVVVVVDRWFNIFGFLFVVVKFCGILVVVLLIVLVLVLGILFLVVFFGFWLIGVVMEVVVVVILLV